MTINELLDDFILELRITNHSEKTVRTYTHIIDLYSRYTDLEIEDIKPINIKQYIYYLQPTHKISYINTIIKTLNSMFNYAIYEGYINKSPMERIKLLKASQKVTEGFTNTELKRIISYNYRSDYLGQRDKAIIYTLLDLGIRVSELCNIKISDIKEGYIIINGKGNKQRMIGISCDLRLCFNKYLRSRNKYCNRLKYNINYLFISKRGKQLTPTTIEGITSKVCNAVGIDSKNNPHKFRHTYAHITLLSTDLYTTSKLLGHSSTDITSKVYLSGLQNDRVIKKAIGTSPLSKIK